MTNHARGLPGPSLEPPWIDPDQSYSESEPDGNRGWNTPRNQRTELRDRIASTTGITTATIRPTAIDPVICIPLTALRVSPTTSPPRTPSITATIPGIVTTQWATALP